MKKLRPNKSAVATVSGGTSADREEIGNGGMAGIGKAGEGGAAGVDAGTARSAAMTSSRGGRMILRPPQGLSHEA